jgi:thioredoxin-dependent peroxiredoxin
MREETSDMRRSMKTALLLVGLSLGAPSCGQVVRPDGGAGLLPVGSPAPDMTATTNDGGSLRLSAVQGHPSVVYFYPRDETPGCTKEACAFRDAFAKYETRGVAIFGVSRDSEASHRSFRLEHKLPFPLVADEAGTVARAYGVSSTLGMASRVTFLVGADGRIARVWPDVDPGVHADQVLAAVDGLVPAAASASP